MVGALIFHHDRDYVGAATAFDEARKTQTGSECIIKRQPIKRVNRARLREAVGSFQKARPQLKWGRQEIGFDGYISRGSAPHPDAGN